MHPQRMGCNGDAANLKGATVREGIARACKQGLSVAPEGALWVGLGVGMHTNLEHPALCDHTLCRGQLRSFQ